ncbi:carbohydrate ABC transporter permease, partial [Phytoactinopolyspora endophytica]|uniref:carbohydrate ABC transporter permease n=1 Tax=Phytoactinopolyspora endophytica TaxID=1642495 RepID=UPI00197C117D
MRTRIRNWGPGLLLVAPSIVIIAIFVYVLIGATVNESLSDRHTAAPAENYVGLENYTNLFEDDRFTHSLRNLAIMTVVFVGGTLFLGILWAFLLEKGVRGEGIFRSVYLFPMAVSFVASGVVWRWLLNSSQGEGAGGLNALFGMVGL